VPLGAFLSGGVDSSVIVAEMASGSNKKVKTFAIGYRDNPAYDESAYAEEVAAHLGVDHENIYPDFASSDLNGYLDLIVGQFDQPYGNATVILTAILTRNVAHPHESIVDTFLMSCRALGRGIEDAVLHGLLNFVAADGGQRLIIPTIEGPRNQPCLEFLKRAIPTQRAGGEFELDAIAGHALPEHIAWDGPARLVSRKAA